ncbi:lung seven transmembrane receptor-domain-containing protein [Geopyxis carbonaria]|nr:lung seven transmembrane receptor-domain-containing protein [Geopyxis carbonaria]
MRRWFCAGALALLLGAANAAEYALDQGDEQQQCSGMYSKKAWGGNKKPSITVVFPTMKEHEKVSLIIFEYEDERFLGKILNGERQFICEEGMTKGDSPSCKEKDIGKFLVDGASNNTAHKSIYTDLITQKSKPITYEIKRTGYYCVWSAPFKPDGLQFNGVVTFQNSFGELPASQIAKLPFYGGLTIVYAVVGALWAFLYVQHRRDILPVQNYITAIIIFLIIEMLITWAFYDYMNIHGANTLSRVLMIIVAILNAARNSFSFFLLLIVCMGYGVVKPTLGELMKWVRILALTHFAFGVVYAVASLTITPDSAGPLVMLVILPLAATLTAFYVWTLNSLKLTMKELEERKQHTKGLMYKRLWWVLLSSIFIIFGFFFANSLTFAGHGSPDFIPTHWRTRWFVLDGWLNLVYLADIAIIAYLWRPTANNRRFAMSDELAQDEDGGFEIASIGGSELDEDEEDAVERGHGPGPGLRAVPPEPAADRDRRISMEEPIFEVGDEGGWSDGEPMSSDDEEDKKLTGKKD